jgi:hypothetical protein
MLSQDLQADMVTVVNQLLKGPLIVMSEVEPVDTIKVVSATPSMPQLPHSSLK